MEVYQFTLKMEKSIANIITVSVRVLEYLG